ncbi:MAG: hypothetical protein J0L92_16865 [Deltaproteobacteria bacterium]|nr:hypothetical protein [Deltaproteobacteria bacterium]
MKIRVMQAFSGNNSGSYVLLGSFEDAARVDALSVELSEVFEAHARWLADRSAMGPRSPLAELATKHGIETEPNVGAMDDWPTYGSMPAVVGLGSQLLIFVDYAVTFPRFLGELVYRNGGRVGAEVNHGHEAIVLVHEIWKKDGWNDRDAMERALAACRLDVEEGPFAALHDEGEDATRRPKPIVRQGDWPGMITLVHAPIDVAAGAAAVRALVERHGLEQRLRLFESPRSEDPLSAFRVT